MKENENYGATATPSHPLALRNAAATPPTNDETTHFLQRTGDTGATGATGATDAHTAVPPLPEPQSWLNYHPSNGGTGKTAPAPFLHTVLQKAVKTLRAQSSLFALLLGSAATLLLLSAFAFDGSLTWQGWAALTVLFVTLSLLVSNALPIAATMLLGVVAMLCMGLVSPEAAITGFANTGVVTVAVLFPVAEGVQRTSVLMPIFRVVLGKPKHLWEALARLLIPVSLFSAFLNNTPVVAMLIPVVLTWGRRAGFPASKLLMPMNNAALLGGTLTLLGTSTNLVVSGLAESSGLVAPGEMPIFGITAVGAASLVAGLLYMIFAAYWLPNRDEDNDAEATGDTECERRYTISLRVMPRSPLVGDTVLECGLRNPKGPRLLEVTRADGSPVHTLRDDTKVLSGDVLRFQGDIDMVRELYHSPGVLPATQQSQTLSVERHERHLINVVISPASRLVGLTVRRALFHSRFSGVVIGAHRYTGSVCNEVGDLVLKAGDALLVEAGKEFAPRFANDANFASVREVPFSQPPREDNLHRVITVALTVCMIVVASAGWTSLLTSASAAAFIMVATGCLTFKQAAASVDIPVILTIAASFGLSNGLQATGAAQQLAQSMMDVFKPFGATGLCLGVYVGTAVLASVITHNGAVALLFPVVKGVIDHLDGSDSNTTLRLMYTMMMAGSSSFSTPVGYQTNMMVHAPGGYTFLDWIVFGVPLQIVECALTVGVLMALFP